MPDAPAMPAGAGLGLRRSLMGALQAADPAAVDFFEVAPENWIGVGGRLKRQFHQVVADRPLLFHGLSLDIGGPDPLDRELITRIGALMRELKVPVYSEHLSFCGAGGHLYDLLPIPFTQEAVDWVAGRVRQVQDMLGAPLVLENASYYAQPWQDMSEVEFIAAVASESGCELLLDVNNVYVNSINHGYDPRDFIASLPLDRVRYLHVAGHYDEAPDLKVDTHGADVIDPVWALLADTYALTGPLPTLLERDFNFPPLGQLLAQVDRIRQLQVAAQSAGEALRA
ncbi:MAG: hypothetical protein CME40_16725 [Haliea sp.]|nr:hypothetical protein [Haliea sp.]|tara:strand:+ start:88949 stop:89800 length:852 start_codon:yes stop_codon:yes gene_type:complete